MTEFTPSATPLMVETGSLRPRPHNPKEHPDSQVADIARVISEVGFLDPIEVDPEGVIIAGHGRWLAAQRLGLEQVPVIVHATSGVDADMYAITHNALTMATGVDMREAVAGLASVGIDPDDQDSLSIAGLTSDDFAALRGTPDSPDTPPQSRNVGSRPRMEFRFFSASEQAAFGAMLRDCQHAYPRARTLTDAFVLMARDAVQGHNST